MELLNRGREKGFTLMEMLYVLFIMALILLIAVPMVYHAIIEQKTKQFFTILDSDILRIQNQAMQSNEKMTIFFSTDHYVVMKNTKTVYTRTYPDNISFIGTDMITYNGLGTVSNPRTFLFYSGDDFMYQVIFPLGKGRHHIEKNKRLLP